LINADSILFFNVHGSVHRKNILIYIQQDATLHSLFYLETVLHVSRGITTHHQERKQLYLQHLVFVKPLLLSVAIAATLHSLFYLETVLHVSGVTTTHHEERKQLYLQHLVFVTSLLPLSWKSWNWFECAVGGVRHPQHTQTGSH
jgi:hypothetical protein